MWQERLGPQGSAIPPGLATSGPDPTSPQQQGSLPMAGFLVSFVFVLS